MENVRGWRSPMPRQHERGDACALRAADRARPRRPAPSLRCRRRAGTQQRDDIADLALARLALGRQRRHILRLQLAATFFSLMQRGAW